MGGQTAMCFAAQNPDLLHKLVLLAPAGVEDYSEKQAAVMDNLLSFYPVLGKNKTAVKIGFRQNFYEMPPDAEPLINERIALAESEDYPLYTKLISQCVRAILTTKPEFSKIRTKTLIIYGENDRLIPNAVLNPKQKTMHIADRAGRLIADSKVILLKKTGHFLQFEKSEEINFLIKQFLANDK
jgi:pimeloyl-ACP methyl ester carboxylesterase